MKHPKAQYQPATTGKVSRAACDDCHFQDRKPSWRFGVMDTDGPFGWNVPIEGVAPLLYVLPKLKEFETMTWQEIAGRRHHNIPVDTLSTNAKRRLSDLNLDDIDEVFSLALMGLQRVVGIRDQNVFRVLWWDPEHQVCLSHKKRT
ncbi:MAG: hypothetical protein HQL87_18010 [Magnetococcales bacterium]|nr:hypothetical protein [Magnetococcales bacterium]